MTVQVKDILHESRRLTVFNLQPECLNRYFSGLSFLTPVNILIKNYCMKNTTAHHWAECIDHD